jgi:uncharacterized protein YbjT (DUF2867 family)
VGLILVNRLIKLDFEMKLFVRNRQRVKHFKQYRNVTRTDIELTTQNRELIAYELEGIDTLYYLIHSMDKKHAEDFEEADLRLSKIISEAAAMAGVKHIIYLGGLGQETPTNPLSMHLKNRHQVGERLRKSGIPTTEIRAGVIIGAGSASFEIIRALGSKLPFIPQLSYNQGLCHPIDIDDVIGYLINAYKKEEYFGEIVEIGMEQSYKYDEMIALFAKEIKNKNLKKKHIYLLDYLLTKNIIASIVSYLSAIPYALSKPLIEGLDSMAIKGNYNVEKIDNSIIPLDFISSIKKASQNEKDGKVESFWSIPMSLQVLSKQKEQFIHIDAKESHQDVIKNYKKQGLLFEIRERYVDTKDVNAIFNEVKNIGGAHGYWSPHWLWKIRAFVDKLVGGPGFEVGKKACKINMRIGERVDFWIVSAYLDKPAQKVLTLKGRIKSPGDSWLQFALIEERPDKWRFTLRAYFHPSGVFGYFYWYALYFVHKFIFDTMIDNIILEARKQ